MKLAGTFLLRAALALAVVPLASVVAPTDARASVSIAVTFEALVKDADAVGVVTPVESYSVWEDKRIYTYTRLKVDRNVAGQAPTGSDGWVRTAGGLVDGIGQNVDGEPVFTVGRPALVFLRTFKPGTWQVSARAQGQFPVLVDAKTKASKVIRSGNVGLLLPPKLRPQAGSASATSTVDTQSVDPRVLAAAAPLAGNVLHERALDDAAREIAAAWLKAHPSSTK